MTLKEFLALPPEEQAKLAGQLRDKPWKHKFEFAGHGLMECHCGASKFRGVLTGDESCSFPDPIKIDWNNAKRLQGECDGLRFQIAMLKVMQIRDDRLKKCDTDYYVAYVACILDIIAACMLAKNLLETE